MSKVVRSRLKPGAPRHFIKQWLRHRGLTQVRLADRIGVTHGALSQLENGKISYTQPMLEALADALQCEPPDLLWREPDSQFGLILDYVRKLQPEEQKRVFVILEALRKAG